jgi:hypothetical protein
VGTEPEKRKKTSIKGSSKNTAEQKPIHITKRANQGTNTQQDNTTDSKQKLKNNQKDSIAIRIISTGFLPHAQ